mgnify:CR=1 FL=1
MRFNNTSTGGDVYAYGAFDHTLPPGTTFTVSGNYYSISGGNATVAQIYPYNEDLRRLHGNPLTKTPMNLPYLSTNRK